MIPGDMLHFFMINFLKRNWALMILIVIGILYVKNNYLAPKYSSRSGVMMDSISLAPSAMKIESSSNFIGGQAAPSDSSERIIIENTSLSLQVKEVAESINKIEEKTKALGGFLINSHLSKPESAASGTISVRIPEDKRKEAMDSFKEMAVKVVSESVNGNDVTDQYMDLEARLEVLYKTKVKYEEILQRADKVNDLLNVQQQLTSLQNQIDNLKGQQKYLEQSAKLTKITVYLSTDELALPYAPTNEWRPAVIFKEAVRSLVGVIRGIGSLIIWGVVYIPLLIPILLIIRWIKRKKTNS